MPAWLNKFFTPSIRQPRSATSSTAATAPASASRDEHQSAGNDYLVNGNFSAAEQSYRQAIATAPEFAKAYCKLGFVLKEQGRHIDAEVTLRQAVALDPAIADVWYMLGDFARTSGQEKAAIALLSHALDIDPGFEAAYLSLIQLLRARDGSRAQTVLKQALQHHPQSPKFHFMLGNFEYEANDFDGATAHFKASIIAQPDNGHVYANLALAWQQQNSHDDALAATEHALQLQPGNPDLHMNHGVILEKLDRLDQAVAAFQRAISLRGNDGRAYANLALALYKQNKHHDALAAIEQALQLQPDNSEWHMTRGLILEKLDRFDPAVTAFQHAISLRHDYVDAFSNLGNLYQKEKKFELAESSYRSALTLRPDSNDLRFYLGNALQSRLRFSEAVQYYRDVLTCDPAHLKTYATLASVYRAQGKFTEAIRYIELALKIDQEYAEGRFYKACLLLTLSEFTNGWREYEYRWQTSQLPRRESGRPLWLGEESLCGKTILLHAEQGYGDTIQFVRYVALVKDLGATVLLSVPQALIDLFRPLPGVSQISTEIPDTHFDFQCPLMSLPMALKTTLESIPASIPYLSAPTERADYWAAKLSTRRHPRIGLVWAGNPTYIYDRNRSLPLRTLLPLRTIEHASFFCLQKDIADDDRATMAEFSEMQDLSPHLLDYRETAAIIANLDMVITVDTSVGHLAGAMGKPVWIMIPFIPDFRWMLDRNDSPWYPSVTLFRQDANCDWTSVVQKLTTELEQFCLSWHSTSEAVV